MTSIFGAGCKNVCISENNTKKITDNCQILCDIGQKWHFIFVVVCLVVVIGSKVGHAQSLDQVLNDSVNTHPEVKALQANRRAIGEELNAARGLGLPGVNILGKYGQIDDDNTSQDYNEWSVVLRQPLLDGGRMRSEVSRQGNRVSSAEERARDTINTIGLQVAQAYLEVNRARRVLNVAKSNEHAIGIIVEKVSNRVSTGAVSRADKELALSRLYAARNMTAQAEIGLQDAVSLYRTITNASPGKLSRVKLKQKHFPKSRRQAVEAAQSASPKILAMQYDAVAAEFAIGTARASVLPTVDLELSAKHRDAINGTSAENTSYDAMVVFKMSLYNGGINTARIREAEHRADEARELADAAVLNVSREVSLTWNIYAGAPKKIQALNGQANSSLRLKKLRERQYVAGASSLIAILDAQNEYVISKVQSINESSMQKFSYFKILAATGSLLEAYDLDERQKQNAVTENEPKIVYSLSAVPLRSPKKPKRVFAGNDNDYGEGTSAKKMRFAKIGVPAISPVKLAMTPAVLPDVETIAKKKRRRFPYVSDR